MTRAQDAKIGQMAKALRKARKQVQLERFLIVESHTLPIGDESTLDDRGKQAVAHLDAILKQIDEALE